MKKLIQLYGIAAVLVVLFCLGCTKEKPFKEVLKYQTLEKAVIPENVDYLYLPSVVDSPRKSTATRPHWQGQAKRVRFQFHENELSIYEVESDSRFTDNLTNRKPVMTIPVEHLDYKCIEDAYGECTNAEKQNDEVSWEHKKYFKAAFREFNLKEVNFLPIQLNNLFGNCYEELSSEFVNYTVEEGAINFEVEKTFRTELNCVSSLESLSDLTFSVRYHYSFIRLDMLTTPGYKPVTYERRDEGMFGYFTTENLQLDVDNNDVVTSEKVVLNRWNPNKKVVYYLNDAFNKPEYARVRKVTEVAFETINSALKTAGTNLELELKAPNPKVQSGDLRYNMIVLVEDPQASGIIGYGPSAANPLTGEIVNARTVMYLGTIKKFLKQTYEEVIEARLERQSQKQAGTGSEKKDSPESPQLGITSRIFKVASTQPKVSSLGGLDLDKNQLPRKVSQGQGQDFIKDRLHLHRLQDFAVNPQTYNELTVDLRQRLEVLSRHNAYPAELFNFHAAIEKEIDDVLEQVESKPWVLLTEDEKSLVINTLLPYVWVPTLVHELGHNLGLRHNFAGSEDKDNFYSEQELAEMGVQTPFKYSSIMDYAYRTTNELRMMGKYDIAALRFAYAEKVELTSGELVDLKEYRKLPDEALKSYSYCTDEHVSVNPNCNRFDEGTNLVEIAEHLVRAYHHRYARANLRNNRRNFSQLQDMRQIAYLENTFFTLRMMFERYESIKNDYALGPEAPEWESIAFLKDLKAATLVGGRFFLEVLKTPDTMCAIATSDQPTMIIAVVPIQDLSPFAVSCFDQENVLLREPYIIVGQGGHSFQSRKDPRNGNPYADQIDVRGIWMDKLIAIKYLLARELQVSLFDDYTENFLHLPELQGEILNTFRSVLMDEFQGPVTFDSIFGFPFTLDLSYRLADSHQIPKPMSTAAQLFLGLPSENTLLSHQLVAELSLRLPSPLHQQIGREVSDIFSVYREIPRNGRPAEDYVALEWGSERFHAAKENVLAMEVFSLVQMLTDLSALDATKLAAAVEKLKANPDAEIQGAEEQAVKTYGVQTVERVLNGGYKPTVFYIDTLRRLVPFTEGEKPKRADLLELLGVLKTELFGA